MARLLLILVAAAVCVGVIVILASAWSSLMGTNQRTSGSALANAESGWMGSGQLRKLAYVALIVVLFGVTSGWLGGL